MQTLEQGIITLLKSAITGQAYPLPEDFDLEKAYPVLKRHSILALGYTGAAQCGINPAQPVMQKLLQDFCESIVSGERQLVAIDQIYRAFDAAGIDYMPVKGCNLKAMYPEQGLRSMGDADILIRWEQRGEIGPIMQSLGFKENAETDYEWVWVSPSLHAELHKRLVPSYNKDYYSYYGDGWRLASRAEGTHYYMTDEDAYIYVFTHFAKHYRSGGIGCRHLLDLWVYRRACPDMDMAYIEHELKKLSLFDFHLNICRVLQVWFENAPTDEKTEIISHCIMNSGDWGSYDTHLLSAVARKAYQAKSVKIGRARWLIDTVFPARYYLQTNYPFVKKTALLIPVAWIMRWCDVLLHRRKNIARKFGSGECLSDQKVEAFQQALEYVGLRFTFEEQNEEK